MFYPGPCLLCSRICISYRFYEIDYCSLFMLFTNVLVPYRCNRRGLPVCPSVCLSVFRTFFHKVRSYCIETLYHDLQIQFEYCRYPPIFGRVMPLELSHFKRFYSFPHFFFSLLTDIHLKFGTLLCHTKMQIKFEFGFDPLFLAHLS
jgi:hypothetical protein